MLERIWQRNQAVLRSIVRNVLIDSSHVEDILQEAFAKVLRQNKSFSTEQEAYNYIRRAVLNTTIDHYRSHKRWKARFMHFSEAALRPGGDSQAGPLTLLIHSEERQLKDRIISELRRSLKDLPPQLKEAIDIFFFRDCGKIKEVCKERGIPYSTLRSRAVAAIDQIRNRLKACGLYPVR